MFDRLAREAGLDPSRPALVGYAGETSYGQLVARARRAAAGLRARGIERLALVDFEAEVVLPLLAAGELAGVEICVYPPDEADRIADLAARFDHDVVLTDRGDLAGVAATVLRPADLLGHEAVLDADLPDRRPHLVLTTGTTGVPRAVRHDWRRLDRQVARVRRAPDQRWLLAYGLHQFAGLQVLLHVVAAGATLVAPAPRRPRAGLAAMRALGVTHASATPTYWRFLLAELRSDGGAVPALEQITLGGEAVSPDVLAELGTVFGSASISQVYAASEFGSAGSVRDGRPGLSVDVLDRGEEADLRLRVVDGELWIRSRTGMLGYHGEPEIDPDAWRPTGDLVEIVGDRIEFRGRSSEVINVGGVKVHPLPVEHRIAAVPGVEMARVYGRPNPMTGAIVAAEIVPRAGADRGSLKEAVRESCADLPAVSRPRSIRFVDGIATRGGKITRSPLR